MSAATRVLVIDDSAVVRGLLSKLIGGEPDLEFAGSAKNGQEGIEKAKALEPDIIVLDIEMPVMSGLEAVGLLRKNHPTTPIIMFSTLTAKGAKVTLDALADGATDYATKPAQAGSSLAAAQMVRADLLTKIRGLMAPTEKPKSQAPPKPITTRAIRRHRIEAAIIGSSTGGPAALERTLSKLPARLPVPIFIVQHMPPTFTEVLAKRLDKLCNFPVHEASAGLVAETGHCYLAPGGHHMRLARSPDGVEIRLDDGPKIKSCRPSVDALFDSATEVYGDRLVATILTGMGDDGLDSCHRLSELEIDIIVQDEATSVVWGMPGAVAKAGLATSCLPLDEVPAALMDTLNRQSAATTRKVGVTTS